MQVYKGAARRASPKAPSRRRRYDTVPRWTLAMTRASTVARSTPSRACNSVAGQAQTARTWGLFERTAARRKRNPSRDEACPGRVLGQRADGAGALITTLSSAPARGASD